MLPAPSPTPMTTPQKSALVTGGAGFIGSHLASRLLSEGWSVDVVDNLCTGFRENVPAGASFIEVDVSRDDLPTQLPAKRYDAVFHLAAVADDVEVAQVLIDLGHRARQHLALASEDVDEIADRLRIGDRGANEGG